MAIAFKKLNSQIHLLKPEVKAGYIFIATDKQKDNFVCSISKTGSKQSLLRLLIRLIRTDEYFKAEFTIIN